MFGLGWTELLVIGAVIAFIAGPAGVKKALSTARQLQKAKSDLQGGRVLDLLAGDEEQERRGPAPAPERREKA